VLALSDHSLVLPDGSTDGGCKQVAVADEEDEDDMCPTGNEKYCTRAFVISGVIIFLILSLICCCCFGCCVFVRRKLRRARYFPRSEDVEYETTRNLEMQPLSPTEPEPESAARHL